VGSEANIEKPVGRGRLVLKRTKDSLRGKITSFPWSPKKTLKRRLKKITLS